MMVTLAQLAAVDARAADWCATLRASVDSQTTGHDEKAANGLRGLLVGRLNATLGKGNADDRHLFTEVGLGVPGGRSGELTTAQCRATLWWLDDGGEALVGRIVAAAMLAAGQEPLPGMDEPNTERRKETMKTKIRPVSATYARTFNLGDYNSIRAEFTVEADFEKGDDPDEVSEALWEYAKEQVKAATLPAVKAAKAKASSQPVAPGPGHPGNIGPAPPHASAPPAPRATGATSSPGTPTVVPQTPTPGGNVEEIDAIKVTAPSGKPVVEFWRAGRKYPEVKWQLGGQALIEIAPTLAAAGYTAEHFDAIGAEYQVKLRVHWVTSPKNDKWKDVILVEFIA